MPELDFVMYKDEELIGQNMFMKATIAADDGRKIPIMTMGPICIKNEFKGKGYGKCCLIIPWKKQQILAAGHCVLKGILIFTAKAALSRLVSSEYVIMDCRRERMHHFFAM